MRYFFLKGRGFVSAIWQHRNVCPVLPRIFQRDHAHGQEGRREIRKQVLTTTRLFGLTRNSLLFSLRSKKSAHREVLWWLPPQSTKHGERCAISPEFRYRAQNSYAFPGLCLTSVSHCVSHCFSPRMFGISHTTLQFPPSNFWQLYDLYFSLIFHPVLCFSCHTVFFLNKS